MSKKQDQSHDPKIDEIKREIVRNWDKIKAVAPPDISKHRLVSIAVSAINANKKLKACTTDSIVEAIVDAAIVGIEPGDGTDRAYFVSYKGICEYQLGYRGLTYKAWMTGNFDLIDTQPVYQADQFECVLGTDPSIKHIPTPPGGGPLVAAYAVIRVKGSSFPIVEVLSIADAEKIRRCSKGGDVWANWEGEMWRKSVLKRALKRAPISGMSAAMAIVEKNDARSSIPIDEVLDNWQALGQRHGQQQEKQEQEEPAAEKQGALEP
jgi:recombination protein RecT